MTDLRHIRNTDPLAVKGAEGASADQRNFTTRRTFLQAAGLGAATLAAHSSAYGAEKVVDKDGKVVQGFEDIQQASSETSKGWEPFSDRKIRVGIVGYGFCKFGAAFGFQDHPNVEVVAVSDLFPDRCEGLAKACRCSKTYESLEKLVQDDSIEAVFCATDPPHHAQHCMEVLKHGKHVAVNCPAVWGSVEQADRLFEAVKKANGLQYMMFETSYYHPGLWPVRQIYKAGGFGKHVYSEGEYYHYTNGKEPMPSYMGWRDGFPPLWYATHSTAYYVGVTGGAFSHVSCQGKPANWWFLQPGVNKFNNTFASETALYRTSDGGSFRAVVCWQSPGHEGVKGRFRGELASYDGDTGDGKNWGTFDNKSHGMRLSDKALPNLDRPPLPPSVDPGGHGGAEGQLMNEFVTAILQDRTPWCNVAEALNMSVAGVVASESAKKDGELQSAVHDADMMIKPHTFRHASFYGRIGIARADITPPVGIHARNWGVGRQDVARSIHRPLTLTALTLGPVTGGQPLVLIEADLGGWKSLHTFRNFSNRLQQELSVEPANLVFALSHTHSAPVLMEAEDSLPGSVLHQEWMRTLFESAVGTVRRALECQFEGIVDWHVGRCGLATNRDLPDPEASRRRFVCGYNPNGESDDVMLVGRITDATGQIRALLVNYACHPTTLAWENEAISPDFVGAMRETIQQATNAPALFLQGNSGELAPRYQYVGDPAIADRHGRHLAFAALATLSSMEPPGTQLGYKGAVESGAPLAVWRHEPNEPSQELGAMSTSVALPIKNWPFAAELEFQRRECTDDALEERLRRKLDIRLSLGDVSFFELPVYVWRIGDAVLVGSCCEAYSVLQQELRRRFPDTMIVCMNLINGSLGYLPPSELYDEDIYSVWQTPFDRGSYERLLETMTREICNVLNEGRTPSRHPSHSVAAPHLRPKIQRHPA